MIEDLGLMRGQHRVEKGAREEKTRFQRHQWGWGQMSRARAMRETLE